MPAQKVCEFSRHVGALCARAGKNVYDLAPELLAMIYGRVKPTKAAVQGLARQLDSNVRYLEKVGC